jgi:hypothetical protein
VASIQTVSPSAVSKSTTSPEGSVKVTFPHRLWRETTPRHNPRKRTCLSPH